MHSETDSQISPLTVSAGEILAGAFFGAVLAALLVILRDGTPTAGGEILGGALLFGSLGAIRATRHGESMGLIWRTARLQWAGTRGEIALYARAAVRTLRAFDHWALQRVRKLAESKPS